MLEMEELIRELNDPVNRSSSERVQHIQRSIQQLQRESAGWQKGFDLLRSPDQSLRFYGALTLIIKVNSDWENDGFDEDETARTALLERLVNAYVQLVSVSDSSIVLLKLCSTLAAYFVKDDSWQTAVGQVATSLLRGQYVPLGQLTHTAQSMYQLSSMNFNQIRGILWFASTLVEDISRLDTSSTRSSQMVERLRANSWDAWLLMETCLDSFLSAQSDGHSRHQGLPRQLKLLEKEAVEIVKLVLSMILPWLEYLPPDVQSYETGGKPTVDSAQDCVFKVFACFSHEALQDLTIQTLTGVAESWYQIFRRIGPDAVMSITSSTQATVWLDEMHQGDYSPEAVRYVEFLIALINSEDLSSPKYLENSSVSANLLNLKKLMSCDGIAVIEDEVCQLVLQCLNEVVEHYEQWPEDSRREVDMTSFVFDVCNAAISKSKLPLQEMDAATSTWDIDEYARFHDFRHDVTDFLESAFAICGSHLIDNIARGAIANEAETDWQTFEASLFCLIEFSETMDHRAEHYDRVIGALLNSTQWTAATRNNGSTPSKARQTAIKFVAQQTGYLRRHLSSLVPCLDFLFSSLRLPGSTQAASRAIQTLCYSERQVLVEALPQFLDSLAGLNSLDAAVRHRIYGAVAAIIQALPRELDKIRPLNELLDIVLSPSGHSSENSTADGAFRLADLLQALVAVSKGIKAPSDAVVDLESSGQTSKDIAFWTSGHGKQTQERLFSICRECLSVPGLSPTAEIVDAACDLMKSGYLEDHPSPFKFSPEVNVHFLASQIYLNNQNISAVLTCTSTFLISVDQTVPGSLSAVALEPVFDVSKFLVAQRDSTGTLPPSDFPASAIDLFTRLLSRGVSSLFGMLDAQRKLASILDLALVVISESDTLPRRRAASCFATMFEATGHKTPLEPQQVAGLRTLMQEYTPSMVARILGLIAGECARSEIESITEPLRKLIVNQTPTTRTLLREAMSEKSAILSQSAYAATTPEQRSRFIAQIEGLRGARKTVDVARDFWLSCRGDAFGYVT